MGLWGKSRTCRASVLRDILLGRLAADPDPHGLRLRGARIAGQLDLENLVTDVWLELAHPELTRLLREHLASFGPAADGRLFAGVGGGELPTITYRRAWIKARQVALTAAEQASPLARRPYDLRHACLSTWLDGGVYPTQVAEWAVHSVDVLLRIYAKCVVGQDELAKRRTSEAYARTDTASPPADPGALLYWALVRNGLIVQGQRRRPAVMYQGGPGGLCRH